MVGTLVGVALVWLTLAAEGAAAFVLWGGHLRRGRRLLVVGALSAGGAVALLGWALVTNDFGLVYVADQSARAAPGPYRLAGLWGGMAGSLLLWVAILACWAVTGTALARRRTPAGAAAAGAVLAGVTALFALPLVVVSRPFDVLAVPALDGAGLAPVLEHPAMLYHPPLLYLGYAATVVPFALGISALRSGRLDPAWSEAVRLSALVAWILLGAGIAAGAHWAYLEAGWGGFWAWDPVENAALLPWLVLTALLHALAADRRRRDGRPRTAVLALTAFLLAAFGALLTRSGAAVSVHAFAEAKAVGWFLSGAWVAMAGLSAGAVIAHARQSRRSGPSGAGGAAPAPPPGLAGLTGAGLMGMGTACLLVITVVVLLGTALPVVEGMLTSSPRVVDARYFVLFCGPPAAVVIGLLVLSGLPAPGPPGAGGRRSWRRTAGGGGLAHAGVLLVAAAVAGSALGSSERLVLEAGESARVGGVRVTVAGFTSRHGARATEVGALVEVGGGGAGRRGRPAAVAVEIHQRSGRVTPQAEAAVVSTPLADVLVVPTHIDAGRGLAVLEVHHRPLMMWLWVGSVLMFSAPAVGLARRLGRRHGARRRYPACAPGAGPGLPAGRAPRAGLGEPADHGGQPAAVPELVGPVGSPEAPAGRGGPAVAAAVAGAGGRRHGARRRREPPEGRGPG